ncbi:MAG: amino acid adenylation domain-containing protein, partial [bacterium]|nr:amino acid adenylation domain-containing protein [bacterium]
MNCFKRAENKNIEDVLGLTPLQEGILYHYLKEPESSHYFEQLSLTIRGQIDVELFKQAWDTVVETNEMLRTRFKWEKVNAPVQIVLKRFAVPIVFHDLSAVAVNDKRRSLKRIKNKDRSGGFDLNSVPFRITLCKVHEGNHEMIVSHHHILYDGWSNGILLKEFFSSYNDFTLQRHPSPERPLKTKFKEYINRVQNQNAQVHGNFWRSYLHGFETGTGLSIKPKQGGNSTIFTTGNVHRDVPGTLQDKLDVFVKSRKLTPACLFYSAWGILCQRYSNSRDVLIGTTVSGRSGNIKGIENMVGLFVNTIPLRVRIRENALETVADFLGRINDRLQERERYESTSLTGIKESRRFGIENQLFDTIMVIENYPLEKALQKNKENATHSLTIDSWSMVESTPYDLTVAVTPFDGIGVDFSFNPECFDPLTIERLAGHFMNILEYIVTHPGKEITAIEMLPEPEKNKLLYQFNDTKADYPRDKTIHGLFEEQLERRKDDIAIIGEGREINYMQLNTKAGQLAHLLRQNGVETGNIVAIMMDRSIELVVGIYGILKAGAAYLPIDPDYPEERVDYILRDSGASILLKSEIRNPKSETNPNDQNSNDPNKNQCFPCVVLNFEHLDFEFVSNFGFRISDFQISSANLSYIIYTSGSTGKPKGVIVEHRSVVNLLFALHREYPFTESDTYLLKTSYLFDVSVTELFGWFLGGGRLAVLEAGAGKDPVKIVHTIERERVSHINFVPSMFNVFLMTLTPRDVALLSCLKYIFIAGEALPPEQVNRFKSLGTGISLNNIYGPTEATVYASRYSLSGWAGGGSVPIGKPMQNIALYILDKHGHVQPIHVPGELCVGGTGVARGYLNRPELTGEKFELSPSLYHTGDLARWLEDGNIEFLGRIDHQVKVRGFRVEPGEIESHLLRHDYIKEAVVIPRKEHSGENFLCVYYVPVEAKGISDPNLDPASLKEYLSGILPHYMVPSFFVPIAQMPLTPTGKIHRGALPEPVIEPGENYTAPANETEEKLVAIWSGVLGIAADKISINDHFFRLGGHSLKAVRLIS